MQINRIGGSDVSSILLGYPSTPLGVYLRVVDGVVDDNTNFEAELGRLAEPVIRVEVERELGVRISKPDSFLIGDWGRASPDGIIVANDELSGAGPDLWECKLRWPSTMAHFGEEGTEEIPEKEMLQVQFYLHALKEEVDRARLTAQPVLGRRKTYTIQRNQELGELLFDRMQRFWRDHIEAKVPPPPMTAQELNDAWSGDFSHLKDKDRPLVVVLPGTETDDLISELEALVGEQKFNTKAIEKLKLALKQVIGADYGIQSTHGKITWSNQKGKIDWEAVAREREAAWQLMASTRQIVPPIGSLDEMAEKKRGPDVRVFRTPRSW